jgi:hypothetical protein
LGAHQVTGEAQGTLRTVVGGQSVLEVGLLVSGPLGVGTWMCGGLDAHRRLLRNAGDLSLVPEWPAGVVETEVPSLPLDSRNGRLGGRRRASAIAFRGHTNGQTVQLQDNEEATLIAKGKGEEARECLQCTSISMPFLSLSSRSQMHAMRRSFGPSTSHDPHLRSRMPPVRVSRGSFLSEFSTVTSILALTFDSGRKEILLLLQASRADLIANTQSGRNILLPAQLSLQREAPSLPLSSVVLQSLRPGPRCSGNAPDGLYFKLCLSRAAMVIVCARLATIRWFSAKGHGRAFRVSTSIPPFFLQRSFSSVAICKPTCVESRHLHVLLLYLEDECLALSRTSA